MSAKALRLYEQRGLIAPIRTAAGWRAYGPVEMSRAAEIAALRAWLQPRPSGAGVEGRLPRHGAGLGRAPGSTRRPAAPACRHNREDRQPTG
nr:MerR family transcriptional regulator [Mesorhizobium temperatum]